MKSYVLGFVFFEVGDSQVFLIKKERPPWQKGKWNGVGGSIEDGETSYEAMRREFREETNIDILPVNWRQFAQLKGQEWTVHCFRAVISPDEVEKLKYTDEVVDFFWLHKVYGLPLVEHCEWLVHLARQNIGFCTLEATVLNEVK